MAKVTIDFSQRGMLDGFFSFLQKRAVDPAHAANGDVIADFVDRFLVIEMKRLDAADETVKGIVDIPNDLLQAPKAPKAPKTPAPKVPDEIVDTPWVKSEKFNGSLKMAVPVTGTPPAQTDKPRNGNGHISKKLRDLSTREKDLLRTRFLAVDGMIEEDKTVAWTAEFNDCGGPNTPPLTPFQVPGFISYLHGDVTRGRIVPRDKDAYKAFMDSHRALYPGKYPSIAHAARQVAPTATTQADAAKALWTNRS